MTPIDFDPTDTFGFGHTDRFVSDAELVAVAERELTRPEYAEKRVLFIIPDSTRTVPLGLLFRTAYRVLKGVGATVDVMVALGTHQPMSEAAICQRLELTLEERRRAFGDVRFLNHAWDDPAALMQIGTFSAAEVAELTEGRFALDVPVTINRAIQDYDRLLIFGPVFPHEVVGFSGGNKYLFPGISGAEVLNLFHWLAALISNPRIIGHQWTPVRHIVDRAASLVPTPCRAFCLVVHHGKLAGAYAGATEAAWCQAVALSDQLHITYVEKPFHTVLSCAPPMYDDLWVGGKCMYKLEPVVADGGELIIYAPHIQSISFTHGERLERIGYHVSAYFQQQWDRFQHEPWGVLAHSVHVSGVGTYENGVEKPRVRVTLATGLSEELCRKINLAYRDPASIDPTAFQNREDEGVLYVAKAGEQLYRLRQPPPWATT